MGRRIIAAFLGGLFGLTSGTGFGVLLIQAGVISSFSKVGLITPIGGLLIGLLVGFFGGRKRLASN